MLNKDIPEKILQDIKLVVFDSDGVTIPRGTEINERIADGHIDMEIKTFLISPELTSLIKLLRNKVTVAICSGRSLLYLQSMYGPIIGKGTVLMAENGNLALNDGRVEQYFDYDEQYFETLSLIRGEVEKLAIKGVEPKQLILSVHSDTEFSQVYEIVERHDKRRELKVMWNGEAFDIMRKEVSKAAGLQKLMDKLGVSREQVVAIGDRVNDKEMIELAGVGVSADHAALESDYWTEGEGMPGEILASYLVENIGL